MYLRATSISSHIKNNITASAWRVHSAFAEVCNLVSPKGEICTLVSPRVGNAPLNIVVDIPDETTPFRTISRETPIDISKSYLHIGAALTVDLSGAVEWCPRPDWAYLRGRLDTTILYNGIANLHSYLSADASADSLVSLLRTISPHPNPFPTGERELLSLSPVGSTPTGRLRAGSRVRGNISQSYTTRAAPAASSLIQAITAQNATAITMHTAVLAGLGIGLTPAGDDFLAGVMTALWFTAAPGYREICQLILNSTAEKTTDLSYAFLKAASAGMFGEKWHKLFAALVQGSFDEINRAAAQILSYGATSGADMLTGFVFFMEQQ